MGYIFLSISLLTGVIKGYCGKKTSLLVSGYAPTILVNIIRMLLCTVIGILLIIISNNASYFITDYKVMMISALSGVSTSIFAICWLISVRKGAYMMVDIFLMIGIIIPLIFSKIFFGEDVKLTQWIGICVLVIAVLLICSYNNSIKTKLTVNSLILLIICGISNGIADFSQKAFTKQAGQIPIMVFNFYTYLFSAIVLIAFYLILSFKGNAEEKQDRKANFRQTFKFILIMSICLFLNSYFKTAAAEILDAVQLYPLNQGGGLILSSAMSTFILHEKMTLKGIAGVFLAFAGLIIINLL